MVEKDTSSILIQKKQLFAQYPTISGFGDITVDQWESLENSEQLAINRAIAAFVRTHLQMRITIDRIFSHDSKYLELNVRQS